MAARGERDDDVATHVVAPEDVHHRVFREERAVRFPLREVVGLCRAGHERQDLAEILTVTGHRIAPVVARALRARI